MEILDSGGSTPASSAAISRPHLSEHHFSGLPHSERQSSERRISRKRFVLASAVLTIVFIVWQMFYALATPPFHAPDEPLHFNSVLRVNATGEWPEPGTAHIDMGVLDATRQAGLITGEANDFTPLSRTAIVDSSLYGISPAFETVPITDHVLRTTIEYGSTGSGKLVDQMTQHPPFFYRAAAGALDLVGADQWTWDRQLLFLRFFSILLTVPLVPCAIYTARTVGLRRQGALFVGLSAFFVPQLAFITGSLNNDSLSIGAGALTVAACARAAWNKPSWWNVVLAGFALGLGLLSKGTFIPFGLVVGLSFVVNPAGGSMKKRFLHGISAGMIGVAVGGWWWIRNFLIYGKIQPEGYVTHKVGRGDDPGYFLRTATTSLSNSSWGRFNWLTWDLPGHLAAWLAIFALICVTIALVKTQDRTRRFVLLGYYPLTIILLFAQAWSQYQKTGAVPGTQGRYLFPAVVALLAIMGCAWYPAIVRLSSRIGNWAYAIPSIVICSLAAFIGYRWILACYPSQDHGMFINWERWALVAGFDATWLHWAALTALCGLILGGLVPHVAVSSKKVLAPHNQGDASTTI